MGKKALILVLCLLFAYGGTANALTWAYGFVAHNGKVYEVKKEITLSEDEVGKVIGEVETRADEYSGEYYGNASNYYEIGTLYYEIKDVSIEEAIAVEIQSNQFVKAQYVHDVPSHIYNVIFSVSTWILVGIGVILLGIVVLRSKQT